MTFVLIHGAGDSACTGIFWNPSYESGATTSSPGISRAMTTLPGWLSMPTRWSTPSETAGISSWWRSPLAASLRRWCVSGSR